VGASLTTAEGIKWELGSYSGKVAFHYPTLDVNITYHPTVDEYVVWHGRNEVVSGKSAMCLETASHYILDMHASDIIPAWEELEVIANAAE
jgi:hypothetical protein